VKNEIKKIQFFPSFRNPGEKLSPPEPGVRHVPEWYRALARHDKSNDERTLHPENNIGTDGAVVSTKMCPPFFDAITAGYMYVLEADLHVDINEDGKPDMFSELMISILSTMASFEKQMIKERQMEGVRIAKAKGVYVGRAANSKETPEKFLSKPKNKKIAEYLSSGYKMAEIVSIMKCSFSTVNKVNKLRFVKESIDIKS
jgi:hypothetical protein